MTRIEDIAHDQAPEAASTSPAPEPPATTRPLRGHAAKILEAVAELRAVGKLLANMRPGHRDKLIQDHLVEAGYGRDLPSRQALGRFFARVDT